MGKNYYVNPAIFTAVDKMHSLVTFKALSICKSVLQLGGLEVNQEGFGEFLCKTNFKRFFTFDGDEYKLHHI